MSQEIKFDVINTISLKDSNVKEEFEEVDCLDNKVYVSETTVKISNTELHEYMLNDRIRKYDTLSVDHIEIDLPSFKVNDTLSNNVKMEDGTSANMQIKFCNELLSCSHCHEVYQDYCTKCRVLVHILNKRLCDNTHSQVRELPKYMLETRELIGHLGIFCLKVIPEDVRFGPFSGLNSTGLPLRIKGGRFVVDDNKSEHLNWMQCINPARNIYEQNLVPFQYEDKLYYNSTRRIQQGEELLVYFGEKYEDNLLENMEMEFVPTAKEDIENVFACTFCCLGFSSKEYLAEHKAGHHSETTEMFAVKELTQCPLCKIYLEAKEYFEHHMDYCHQTIARYCVLPTSEGHEVEVETRSSLRSQTKGRKSEIQKFTQCKFRTTCNIDFRHHIIDDCEVKMYKYGISHRRCQAQQSLQTHMKEKHIKTKHIKLQDYKCMECEYKTNEKSNLKRHIKAKHVKLNDYKCIECEYQTNFKSNLELHVKTKHLELRDHKCMECEFKTNRKLNLEKHIKSKHLKSSDYKCMECEYQTNYTSKLKLHIKTKHLKLKDYKCIECEYQTNIKRDLELHIKSKHLKLSDYKCMECEYTANCKSHLEKHIKTKHLKLSDYKCMECDYKTNEKSNLKRHVKVKHIKLNDYKCSGCDYQTNLKSNLELHIKTKHLKLRDYKCVDCEYETHLKSYLAKHVKTKHLKQMDYKCLECEYQTNFKQNLRKHIKTKHLNEKDYKCLECEYKATRKSHLDRHIMKKHLKAVVSQT